jgi:hypothetical protein
MHDNSPRLLCSRRPSSPQHNAWRCVVIVFALLVPRYLWTERAVRHRFINSVLKRDVLEPEAALLEFLGLPAELHLLEDR